MNNSEAIFRPTKYYKPADVSEALSILAANGSNAWPVAGGTDLVTEKDPGVDVLVDISELDLSYIRELSDGVTVGATTAFSEIEAAPQLRHIPYQTLSYAAGLVGTPQIRNMGTIGGNICRPSPCADTAPVLLVLEAVLQVIGSEGQRQIEIAEFFKDVGRDALKHGEIVKEIRLPTFPARTGASFIKKGRVAVGDLSLASAASCVILDDQRLCKKVRIALGAVAPTPLRVPSAEDILAGKKPESDLIEKAAAAAADEIKPISDVRASAEYRRELSRILVARVLQKAVEQADNNQAGV